jgi:ATP-dependent Clp protease ATP-binding subunit ClpA
MFERFTEAARTAVLAARSEAVAADAPMLGTEHLLIALAQDTGVAGDVLRGAGVRAQEVRDAARRAVGAPTPLLDEQDAAALRSVGIDLDAVLGRIEQTFGKEALVRPAGGRGRRLGRRGRRSRPDRFGPRSKKVLELALREALRLHHREIGSAHLLLGLLREGEGLGARLLVQVGVDLDDLRVRTETALRPAA